MSASDGDGGEYFESYGDLATHELMLKDAPRMDAYAAAIDANAAFIRGRVVLDVGAGTGILSLLAARAGAARVYAVEASPMAEHLQAIVEANGFADIITVVHACVEDVTLPTQVDVVVSEWMGFHLLHEAMLDSVLFARAKWLRPGGRMLPCTARVFAAPVSMDAFCADKFGFWSDVRGFDMSVLASVAAAAALAEPAVTDVAPEQLLAAPALVASIDCATARVADLYADLGGRLAFPCTRSGVCHGFALWFETAFPCDDGAAPVTLSTAPGQPRTHWQQSVLLLPEMLAATAGATALDCTLLLRKDPEQPRLCVLDLEM